MNIDGKGNDILWSHVLELYNTESTSLVLYQSGLTKAHVKLNPRSKVCYHCISFIYFLINLRVQMNVRLAMGVLSERVALGLKQMEHHGTADFVLMMCRYE